MATIEERLLAVETWIKTEYGWAAKNWQIVSAATFLIGVVGGHLLWH